MAPRRSKEPPVPMPKELPRDTWLVVEDEQGRLLRVEPLRPHTDLPRRLADAAAEYAALGWIGKPTPRRWTFIVKQGPRSLVVGIRASRPSELDP